MIRNGDEVTFLGATITVLDLAKYDVRLGISNGNGKSAYFSSSSLKQLRKFLKRLQRQLEQGDVDG